MKNKITYFSQVILFAATLLTYTPTLVWAARVSDYKEVSYEDLLNELTIKKTKLQRENESFYNPHRHMGIGYANSLTNIYTKEHALSHQATGIQISAGTDLVNANWYAEGIFRNYSAYTNISEDFSLRELEGKIGYTNTIETIWHYTLSSGLSQRFLRLNDNKLNLSINEATPSLVISTGFFAQVHKNLSVGAEASCRTAIVNRSADQNSFDIALRLNTSL